MPWFHKHLKDVFLKTSTGETESLKIQPCKLKKHWKTTANIFQNTLNVLHSNCL